LIGENVLEKRDEEAVTLCGRRAAARLKAENPLNAMKSRFFDKIKKLKRSEV